MLSSKTTVSRFVQLGDRESQPLSLTQRLALLSCLPKRTTCNTHSAISVVRDLDLTSNQLEDQKEHQNLLRASDPAQKVGNKWLAHSATVKDRLGLPADFNGWVSRQDIQLKGVPRLPRVLDLLNVAYGARLLQLGGASDHEVRDGFYCDLGQAVQRKPWGDCRTICQGRVTS
jgi:hypothetical protein